MNKEIREKLLLSATLGDLEDFLMTLLKGSNLALNKTEPDKDKKYVYGVRGLAKLLGCSVSTAQRRLNSGVLDDCIVRNGRIIMIDANATVEKLRNTHIIRKEAQND